MTVSSLEEVKMMGFLEAQELNAGAGLERSRAGRLAEAQRSSLGPLKGTRRGPTEDGGEIHPGVVLKQIKAARFKVKHAVKSEPLCLSISLWDSQQMHAQGFPDHMVVDAVGHFFFFLDCCFH